MAVIDNDMMLEAAIQLLLKSGYEMTSVEKIAKHAGVARTTYNNRYKTKENLILAAVRYGIERSQPTDIQPSGRGLTEIDIGLNQIAHAIMKYWSEPFNVDMLRLLITERKRLPNLLEEFLELSKSVFEKVLTDYIKTHLNRGSLHPIEAAQNIAKKYYLIVSSVGINKCLLDNTTDNELHDVNDINQFFIHKYVKLIYLNEDQKNTEYFKTHEDSGYFYKK